MKNYGIRKENDNLRINELRLKIEIEDLKLKNKELQEKFSLYSVSQQRGLLKAYEIFVNKDAYNKLENPINKIIEKFLAFNCG